MEDKIKEFERLMMIHDDLDEKNKKIERLIQENLDKIKLLTKNQK
jgi:hypothetical protein